HRHSDLMSPWPKPRRFPVATQTFPGPTILSTRGTLSVPYASAATACAPPIRYSRSTPARWQAARTIGVSPSFPTGETAITSPTPATRAGMPVMSTVDGYAARPPGTYTPTRASGSMRWPRRAPLASRKDHERSRWRAWKTRMRRAASSRSLRTRPGKLEYAAAIASFGTRSSARRSVTPSKRRAKARSARSPARRTRAMMRRTSASTRSPAAEPRAASRARHGRARERLRPAHDGVVAVHVDVGAHAHQLLRVQEAVLEDRLGDRAGAGGARHEGHELRLEVGREAGIGHGLRVDGGELAVALDANAALPLAHRHTRLAELGEERLQMIGARPGHLHRAAGHRRRHHEGTRLDAVRDDGVLAAAQLGTALDGHLRGARAPHAGPHARQHARQADVLRLARRVLE